MDYLKVPGDNSELSSYLKHSQNTCFLLCNPLSEKGCFQLLPPWNSLFCWLNSSKLLQSTKKAMGVISFHSSPFFSPLWDNSWIFLKHICRRKTATKQLISICPCYRTKRWSMVWNKISKSVWSKRCYFHISKRPKARKMPSWEQAEFLIYPLDRFHTFGLALFDFIPVLRLYG